MNALALHQLADIMEGAWNGSRKPMLLKKRGWKVRVVPRAEPEMLFDRRRRIALLWDIFFAALFLALLVALIAGVR